MQGGGHGTALELRKELYQKAINPMPNPYSGPRSIILDGSKGVHEKY